MGCDKQNVSERIFFGWRASQRILLMFKHGFYNKMFGKTGPDIAISFISLRVIMTCITKKQARFIYSLGIGKHIRYNLRCGITGRRVSLVREHGRAETISRNKKQNTCLRLGLHTFTGHQKVGILEQEERAGCFRNQDTFSRFFFHKIKYRKNPLR